MSDTMFKKAWALQAVETGAIHVGDICESEREAHTLLEQLNIHQPQRGAHRVVRVVVTLTVVDD